MVVTGLYWMSQEFSKGLVNGLYNLLKTEYIWRYIRYNPLANLLLTSWDFQATPVSGVTGPYL